MLENNRILVVEGEDNRRLLVVEEDRLPEDRVHRRHSRGEEGGREVEEGGRVE